jgi:hypothetical protein
MTAQHDLDQQLTAFLREGPTWLPDESFDAVRDRTDQTRQRVVIGPWRVPTMSKLVPIGLGAAAVIAVLFLGSQFIGSPTSSVGGPASQPPASATPSTTQIGGTVEYQADGGAATTEVTAVADGASVSGMAVTTFSDATHTVRLECAARDGDTWALGGTTEQTTLPGERAGDLSAVIVWDGSPQQIAIWASEENESDCARWLASIGLAGFDPEKRDDFFTPVESGVLVPPPDLAP